MVQNTIHENAAASSGVEEHSLRIGDVAQRTGLTQRTIRYYEELGLLPPAGRTQGDIRLFEMADVERLQKIVRLRDLFGLSLADIREIISADDAIDQLRTEYRATEDTSVRIGKLDQALTLTRSQLGLLERKLAQMVEYKAELEARVAKYVAKRQELSGALVPAEPVIEPGPAGSDTGER
jgi:MerR family transcriptional regulator, repressor of the yfmOP operon